MIYNCSNCRKNFPRLDFLLHKTSECMVSDESSDEEVYDSDKDPLYSPSSSSDTETDLPKSPLNQIDEIEDLSRCSSPLTLEQIATSEEADRLLRNEPPCLAEMSTDAILPKQSSAKELLLEPGLADEELPSTSKEASRRQSLVAEVSTEPIVPEQTGRKESSSCAQQNSDHVNVSLSKVATKRIWDKKDFCLFCEKLITNFTRHIQRNHSEELEVGKILACPKGSKLRKILFEKLRKKGNFFHNKNCLRENSGAIIVAQRPNVHKPATQYLPCKLCLGFFSKQSLYRHMQKCRVDSSHETSKHARSYGATLLIVTPDGFDDLKKTIFPTMRHDKISKAAQTDNLINEFGARMLQHHKENHMINVISQKMRELGRLKLEMLSHKLATAKDSGGQLEDLITPESYKNIVDCVQRISGFDETTGRFKVPSLAKKLGFSLKTCCEILECKGILTCNEDLIRRGKHFVTLIDKMWKFDISKNATKTLERQKWNKPKMLPLAEDLQSLNDFLKAKEKELCEKLLLDSCELDWRELASVTLVRIILLNRRRSGEAQRLKVAEYKSGSNNTAISDTKELLTKTEKTLCNSFTRFVIQGKGGRPVPVLLTSTMKKSVDVLISTRDKGNINPENPYLFAVPNTLSSCIRGSDILRKYSVLCNCKQPQSIRSTLLRKHVATMSQILNLSNNDIEGLATFLGHSTDVHKEYYRLPDDVAQMAKISKLLLALESGKLKELKGRNFDSIEFSDGVDDIGDENIDANNASPPPKETSEIDDNDKEHQSETIPSSSVESSNKILNQTETVTSSSHKSKIKKRRASSVKVPWSELEKETLLKHFKKHILQKKVPNKEECMKCWNSEPCLSKRSWSHIKFAVKNMFGKL